MMESRKKNSGKFTKPLFSARVALAMNEKRVFKGVMMAQIHRLNLDIISEFELARHLILSLLIPKGQ